MIASAATIAADTQVLYLCGGGKSNDYKRYGVARATLTVEESAFSDFIRNAPQYVVSARFATVWQPVELIYLCSSSE